MATFKGVPIKIVYLITMLTLDKSIMVTGISTLIEVPVSSREELTCYSSFVCKRIFSNLLHGV